RAVSGLTAAAKAFYVASAAQSRPHGVVIFVLPSDAELERATADVRFFLGALEGISPATVERLVLPFPSHEVDPYRGLAPHVGVPSARARALHGIGRGSARVVVASSSALLPRVSAPGRLLGASIDLKPGREVSPTELAELLVDAGFSREDPADEHGEFALRGGILDVYPPGQPQPVRLEFIGDTIESMRTYDAATQRSTAAIDQIAIIPLKDVLPARLRSETEDLQDRSATLFDYVALAKQSRVIVSERDEVEANGEKLSQQVERSYKEASARLGSKEKLLAPPELFAEWPDIETRLEGATSLSQLGIDESSEPIEPNGAVPDK